MHTDTLHTLHTLHTHTRTLATRIQRALLALPDQDLQETVDHWLATVKDQYEDAEIVDGYSARLGYRVHSEATGRWYSCLEDLDKAEPEAEEIIWGAPDIQDLRTMLQTMQPRAFYRRVVVLAAEALHTQPFTSGWGEPPGELSTGYGFMEALASYLTLKKESVTLCTEQFETQHEAELAALAEAAEALNGTDPFDGPPPLWGNERRLQFRLEVTEVGNAHRRAIMETLQQADCQLNEASTEASPQERIEGSISYLHWQSQDRAAVARVHRLLKRWQANAWIVYTTRTIKPPSSERVPRTNKQKRKTRTAHREVESTS